MRKVAEGSLGERPSCAGQQFLFDGIDNNESLVNTIVFFVPPDAIQEFRVDTNVAPAEYGRAGGGVINATYKSGTNDWHGSVFWQIRNSAADANPNYFSGEPAFPFHRNRLFGASGGGFLSRINCSSLATTKACGSPNRLPGKPLPFRRRWSVREISHNIRHNYIFRVRPRWHREFLYRATTF